MTLIVCIAILLGGFFCATDVHGQFCSEGSLSPHTGFCYHVHKKNKDKIEDARLVCRNDYGGDVPSIFTGDENTFIHDLLTTEGTKSHYWIGVNDLYEEDLFRDYMLNEELTYNNWESDEPDNESGFDCAKMLRDDGKWVACPCDKDSDFEEGVICQQPPDPNPFTLCPVNMLPYTTHWYTECYWFSMDEHRALDASLECAAMGSKLAFIEDQALNDFIHSYQESSKLDTVWIGTQQISDGGSGQTYLSVEFGTTIPAYYDYFTSEYSGSESPVCAAMIRTEAGQWNHLSCDDAKHAYICWYNATVYHQNTTSAVTPVGSITTMVTTTSPTTNPSPTITEAATTEATTIPTTIPPTTPSPNTTDFTIPLPNTTTTTASPTTTEQTTSEATITLPATTPTTTHSPTTTEGSSSIATTTLPITSPTTTHSPTTAEGTTILSTTTANPTTSSSTVESTTTLPPITPTTNVITSQSATTESTTSQSTTQEGSSSVGSTTPAPTTTEPTPTTSETTPTVGISTGETGMYIFR
ncbi:A-agglutinin anchorage subunit-like [Strongylocentrotus purpuratus]|uniref:C-type lectin domain-containing protein n=1 Tax=Strongylocentrotus purpuratus TaxID=7668 RepID=A0A7M7NM08_STRPU|nr:A-agglutinin anchorage subunit-like [Strongylocentrotus purpuratus]